MMNRIGRAAQSLPLIALWLVCCTPLRAQQTDPAYLRPFPTVERVLAEIKGRNERDTDARQMGAFFHLRDMIERLSDGRNFSGAFTPDEQRLMTAYGEARGAISRRVEPTLTQNDREDWFIARGRFELDDDYGAEVLRTFFPQNFADAYVERVFADDQDRRRAIESRYGSGWTSIEFALPSAVRSALLVHLLAAVALLAFAFWRETRPFGVDAKDPDLLRAGLWGRYRIKALTGESYDVHQRAYKYRETWTDSDGQSQFRDSTEYTTEFKIKAEDKSIQVPEANLSMSMLAEDVNMSAVWVSKPGQIRGNFLFIMNHDTGSSFEFATLRRYFKVWLWPALPLAWLLVTIVRLSRYSEGSAALFGFIGLCILAVIFGYYWWRNRITARRIERYYDTSGNALKERLNVASRERQAAKNHKQQAIRARIERKLEKT